MSLLSSPAPFLRPVVGRALVVLLVIVGILMPPAAAGEPGPADVADVGDAASAAEGRTWVVDAVDDMYGNRWESVDTGTSEVTIQVGDTVEWQFDVGTAAIEHDLTSLDTGTTWEPAVAEYRVPGDPPVRHTFTEPGVYHYVCSIHGTVMRGTVVVEDDEPGGDNRPPTAAPTVGPLSGPAPLMVHFEAGASDPDGDPLTYLWDFGTSDDASDQSTSSHAMAAYVTPGSYLATLRVSDGRGGVLDRQYPITVTDGDPPPPLEIAATASPTSGPAPLPVRFDATVLGGPETVGEFAPFADGVTAYPALAGQGELVRSAGETYTSLDVTGLRPNAAHMVHVHEQACSVGNGGAHFRFDETQPFSEQNEIWLPFTSDGQGRSGLVEVTTPQRAGPKAVSIVIHDPDNPAKRIGCVDLVATGLDYLWDFGDGATGTGPEPAHTYTEPGTYTATVTAGDPHAGHGAVEHAAISDSVEIVVAENPPPQTEIVRGPTGTVRTDEARIRFTSSERGSRFECRLDRQRWRDCASGLTLSELGEGRHRFSVRATDRFGSTDATPAALGWTVDTTAPVVRAPRPLGPTSDRTPIIRADVSDQLSALRRRDQALYVDGREVGGLRYDHVDDRLWWTPQRALALGGHSVRLVAVDAAGNRVVARWRFTITR